MPWNGGVYVGDQRSPIERLYGFRQKEDELRKLREQEALSPQIQQIMAEGYKPGAEGQPGSFDRQNVINRLYGINAVDAAEKLVNADYKQALAGGGIEKFGTGGDLVRGPDGKMYKQVTSNRGGTKLIPLEGDKIGSLQKIDLGGSQVLIDPYTGQVVENMPVTATPYQSFQMDPEAQGAVKEAEAAAKERGEAAGKTEAGVETAIATYDKTIGIIDELASHPGRKAATGASSMFNVVPGTEAYDFKKKLEQLSGQNFLTEIQRMKGQGALSDSEGKRLEAAAAALDAGRQEEGFFTELLKLRDEINFYKQRAQSKVRKPAQQAPGNIPAGAIEMLRKNPALAKQFDAKYGSGAAARILK